jgi:hypothetical protein
MASAGAEGAKESFLEGLGSYMRRVSEIARKLGPGFVPRASEHDESGSFIAEFKAHELFCGSGLVDALVVMGKKGENG